MWLSKKKVQILLDTIANDKLEIKNLKDNLRNLESETRYRIEEMKYPIGYIKLNYGYDNSYVYTYFYNGKKYERYIGQCEKYIITKDNTAIFLKIKVADTTNTYLIKIGTEELININSSIVDKKIDEKDWIEV